MSLSVQNQGSTVRVTSMADNVAISQPSPATTALSSYRFSSLTTLDQASGNAGGGSSLWLSIKNTWQVFTNWVASLFCCVDTEERIRAIAQRDGFIWFYEDKANPLTSFLGNFHKAPLQIGALSFQCAEAAFQAHKAVDQAGMAVFSHLTGDQAFKKAKILTANWTPDQQAQWIAGENLDVMRKVLKAKFMQNAELRRWLLATGSAYLVEHCPRGRDNFWADNGDGTGQNWLGTLLMELREILGGVGVQPPPPGYGAHLCR